jgi:hypothetical protein
MVTVNAEIGISLTIDLQRVAIITPGIRAEFSADRARLLAAELIRRADWIERKASHG